MRIWAVTGNIYVVDGYSFFLLLYCMFKMLVFIFKFISSIPVFDTKEELFIQIAALKKEVEILKRELNRYTNRIRFEEDDRRFFSFLFGILEKVKKFFNLVSVETVLKWYKQYMKGKFDFSDRPRKKPGRPPVTEEIKQIVLGMKKNNLGWGNRRIKGELEKIGIALDTRTIAKILNDFRDSGDLEPRLTWKKFITSHLRSLNAMDFAKIGSLFGKTYYFFFIISLETRKIVKWSITECPSKLFVQQRLLDFSWDLEDKQYIIHDNDPLFSGIGEFCKSCNLKSVKLPSYSPNLNSYAERFIRSLRRECLDYFIIFSERQLKKIVSEYIHYYNNLRPHQGIGQNVPNGYEPHTEGKVISFPVLDGLHHHYERDSDLRKAS